MNKVLLMSVLLMGTSAFANVAIECGYNVNKDDGTVGKREFMISSEDGGPAGVYDSANKKIRGASLKAGPNGSRILTIITGNGLGGPIGTKYVIDNFRGLNFTVAHQSMIGGYAGGVNVANLDCVVIEM